MNDGAGDHVYRLLLKYARTLYMQAFTIFRDSIGDKCLPISLSGVFN